MPEGDTVWRTADRLHRAFAGTPLAELELRWGELGGVNLLPASTLQVRSRGKHLLHDLDTGMTIHSHLRMDGGWRVHPATDVTSRMRGNQQVRMLVVGPQWAALGMRLGLVEIWPTSQTAERLGYLGPDILGADWDLARALANMRRQPERRIGEVFLDQRNLAGVGTFWASEGLFIRRHHPWHPISTLADDTLAELIEAIQRLMRRGADTGIQSSTGRTARDAQAYVHARSGRPCGRCRTPIRVAGIGVAPQHRVMFYCPQCQGGLAPTDDGRRQRPLGTAGSARRRGGTY